MPSATISSGLCALCAALTYRAVCAKFVLVVGTAAVTVIPVATRVVARKNKMTSNNNYTTVQESVLVRRDYSLSIVAERIPNVVCATTTTLYGGDALVAASFVCAVQA